MKGNSVFRKSQRAAEKVSRRKSKQLRKQSATANSYYLAVKGGSIRT